MPHTVYKGKKDRIWIRRRLNQTNEWIDRAMNYLLEVREVFNEQEYKKQIEVIDQIGQSLIAVEETIKEFRRNI